MMAAHFTRVPINHCHQVHKPTRQADVLMSVLHTWLGRVTTTTPAWDLFRDSLNVVSGRLMRYSSYMI